MKAICSLNSKSLAHFSRIFLLLSAYYVQLSLSIRHISSCYYMPRPGLARHATTKPFVSHEVRRAAYCCCGKSKLVHEAMVVRTMLMFVTRCIRVVDSPHAKETTTKLRRLFHRRERTDSSRADDTRESVLDLLSPSLPYSRLVRSR